jgi:hypothetical protein
MCQQNSTQDNETDSVESRTQDIQKAVILKIEPNYKYYKITHQLCSGLRRF